jgi:hypothetical protein
MIGKAIRCLALGALACAGFAAGCYDAGDYPTDFIVLSASPADQQTNVALNASILIRFSNAPDYTTINGTKQVILVDQANSVIPASFAFEGELLRLTPLTPLGQSATYGVAVRPGVRDVYGSNIKVPFEARFSTGNTVVAIPNWPPYVIPGPPPSPPAGISGTFTATGPLVYARARHCMTRLIDGRVLATGGEHDAPLGTVLQAAELFDPLNFQWTLSSSLGTGINGMHYKRYGHTSTLLKDGKVLVAGGADNHKILNIAEVYDPKSDSFGVVAAHMQHHRVFHTAEIIDNGNVVLIAGWENSLVSNAATPSGNTYSGGTSYMLDSLEIFDVYAGTFTFTAQSLLPIVAYNPNRIQYGQNPGVATNAGRFYHASARLPDDSVMICGGYSEPWMPQAFTFGDAQMFIPDPGGSGVNGTIQHCGTDMTVPRACHTATVHTAGDEAGLVFIAGGFTNSPYTGVLASCELFDYKEISGTNTQWPSTKGCFTPVAMTMTTTRHNHTATLVSSGANKGGVLIAGGAQHFPVQNPQYPNPLSRFYPWLEPTGCGACVLTFATDMFLPYGFGKHTTNPFRGVNLTAWIGSTTDPQGNATDLSNIYAAGVYFHAAASLVDGKILIAGGAWCPFCMFGPNAYSTYFTAVVNGWRVNGPSCVYNP